MTGCRRHIPTTRDDRSLQLCQMPQHRVVFACEQSHSCVVVCDAGTAAGEEDCNALKVDDQGKQTTKGPR
jgi:hypothetical protein